MLVNNFVKEKHMLSDSIKFKGKLHIEVRDQDGVLKDERFIDNLVVQTGKVFFARRAVGTTSAIMSHMAVGTNTVVPVSTDTTLNQEVARVALTSATSTGNVITYVATFPAGTGTGALTEAGIFNASTAGTMVARTVFAVVNKGTNDSITITWNITAS